MATTWYDFRKLNPGASTNDIITYAQAAEKVGMIIYVDLDHPGLFAVVCNGNQQEITYFDGKEEIRVVKLLTQLQAWITAFTSESASEVSAA